MQWHIYYRCNITCLSASLVWKSNPDRIYTRTVFTHRHKHTHIQVHLTNILSYTQPFTHTRLKKKPELTVTDKVKVG